MPCSVHFIMSVMGRGEVQELALALTQLLEIQIPQDADPVEPQIILSSLALLFPEEQSQLRQIMNFQQAQQRWSCVLEFIEINMLNGQQIEVESLGLEQIAQIYQLLIDYTQQLFQEGGLQQQQQSAVARHAQLHEDKGRKNAAAKQVKKKGPVASAEKNKKDLIESKDNKNSMQKIKEKNPDAIKQKQKRKSAGKDKNQHPPHIKNKTANKQQSKNIIKREEKSDKTSPQKVNKSPYAPKEPLQNELMRQITTSMKGNMKRAKNKVLLKDPKSTQEVMKAKRQFQHYLSEYKREGKSKNNDTKRILKKSGTNHYFLKALEKRQKNIQEMVMNEQLKYFLALRDKKVAFINKIHNLTEKLEKQRLIQKQKQQRRLMEQQRTKTFNKIQESNALFDKNMEMLKENYKAIKQKNELQEYNQRIICKQMEDCMKKKKLDQLQQLKMMWEQENLKLNNIMGDEQAMKNKLIDIYRRNRP